MKRVWRWMLNGLVALSLVLTLATAALWVQSYRMVEGYGWDELTPFNKFSRHVGIASSRGSLVFDRDNISDHPDGWERLDRDGLGGAVMSTDYPELWTTNVPTPQRVLRSIGITYGDMSSGSMPVEDSVVILPDWLLTVMFALAPVFVFVRRNKAHARSMSALCLHCGYDLRATPDRCPECGTVPAK